MCSADEGVFIAYKMNVLLVISLGRGITAEEIRGVKDQIDGNYCGGERNIEAL